MSIWKYMDRFSSISAEHQLTLGEGSTPLVRSRSIGPKMGLKRLYFKLEAVNPTGSYKDRFAAAAVSDMLARGKTRCAATSSGNTGSALAAYCAAAGIACQIAIVETAPAAKLNQMLAYGAQLYRVRGFGADPQITADVFQLLTALGDRPDSATQISAYCCSPRGMSGVQTIGYELQEQASSPIDHVFCPAGGGGLTLATARSFTNDDPHHVQKTKIHCVQPAGNDTIAGPLRTGAKQAQPVTCTTSISGLQVASVMDGDEVIAACRASGGTGYLISDQEVYTLQRRLAREEGIFCEPAGAVALAGALQSASEGEMSPDELAVCLVTGSGFKDTASVEKMTAECDCPKIDLEDLESLFCE
ncbi:pyridoxal-phosphate dependent enzyme [Pirellulales bacterium]|nr:pyridoxal-phosphate dependent enzyme [Pirellulales bacterium]